MGDGLCARKNCKKGEGEGRKKGAKVIKVSMCMQKRPHNRRGDKAWK